MPEVLGKCTQLSMVGFKANRITNVSSKAFPPLLRWLILTDNALTSLPGDLGKCVHLQKLMLAGNQLRALPTELAECTRLELLRISANRLKKLPQWLLEMPRLTWLAFAGNPFTKVLEARVLADAPTPLIAWQRLQLQHALGEGASGVIHQAIWHNNQSTQTVAVKLFKGTVTSDGLPECEMAACMHAGIHSNLVSALGRVIDHPQHVQALVMPLIPSTFDNLAAPPSLETCTRDVYDESKRLDWPTTLRIARGITSAAQHLHARGITHGDLYAHNILHTSEGNCLLSDLGAAAFFDVNDLLFAQSLEKIEIRAIGCLFQELVAQCAVKPTHKTSLSILGKLAHQCVNEVPKQRPTLFNVCETLQAIG